MWLYSWRASPRILELQQTVIYRTVLQWVENLNHMWKEKNPVFIHTPHMSTCLHWPNTLQTYYNRLEAEAKLPLPFNRVTCALGTRGGGGAIWEYHVQTGTALNFTKKPHHGLYRDKTLVNCYVYSHPRSLGTVFLHVSCHTTPAALEERREAERKCTTKRKQTWHACRRKVNSKREKVGKLVPIKEAVATH